MTFRNLILTGATAMCLGVPFAVADGSRHFAQIGPDGMPATSEEKAQKERTPRDMAPDTRYRTAQSERHGDQRLTTPLPPTTGSEAKAVTLSQVDEPDRTLINAPVESKDGHRIGEVAQITLDANGKASEVVLNDAARTHIAAGELVFEPDRGVLITQLSPSDLAPAKLPAKSTAPAHGAAPDLPATRPGRDDDDD